MVRSVQHDMLPRTTADEASRQQFAVAFKQSLNRGPRAGLGEVFEDVAAPQWSQRYDHAPASRNEVREALLGNPSYHSWSSLARAAQEQMWIAVGDGAFRERERLGATARELTAVDIHLQTGGYAMDLGGGDCSAGALYECGGNPYAFGQGLGKYDSEAAHVQRFIAQRFPDFRPRRILDMGYSAGSASVPYALAFPEAEVNAIDVGSGMLRYAHARAESLGAAVHFHQMDCGATTFPDHHFDLIVLHNAMHEISESTRQGMLRESLRLLRPGGVCVHQDVPLTFRGKNEFEKFHLGWDTLNNNEPFWEVYATADLVADMKAAGFPPENTWVGNLPAAPGSLPWFVACGWIPA